MFTYDAEKEESRYRVTSSELYRYTLFNHYYNIYVANIYMHTFTYRSTDYGQTFQTQSYKLPFGFQLHTNFYIFPDSSSVSVMCTCHFMLYQCVCMNILLI